MPVAARRLRHGAWNFLFDPDRPASSSPAIWKQAVNGAVLTILTKDVGRAELMFAGRRVLADLSTVHGRFVVLGGDPVRHRLFIPRGTCCDETGLFIPSDALLNVRMAAAANFMTRCGDNAASPIQLAPAPARRRRLDLMLRILDMLDPEAGHNASVREIAGELLYPHHSFGSAAEWKTSSERRQAQRLIAEARQMRAFGYKELLRGRSTPAHPN